MINRIPQGKAIALTGENNQQKTQQSIARKAYTHIFTSPEIALSKKFKLNVLDNPYFAKRLCLLAIDEIHLVEGWGKSFRPLYSEIEKLRKRIPYQVPLLGVSATLTQSKKLIIVEKAGFNENYKLMQTSLDRPEIQQIHRFMQHAKSSCLDLQFVLPPIAKQASDIQKTIIFVNTVPDICLVIDIIRTWMKQLNYPAGSATWVRPYHATMPEFDKDLTAKAFQVPGEENIECIILVAPDAYGMGINNPDIRLVVQWDLPINFDSMIQRMGRAGRRGGQATFILFTPKWTQVKDATEVEQRLAKRTEAANANLLLSDSNRPKVDPKQSRLGQVIEAADEQSDAESAAGSELDEFDDPATNALFDLVATEAEEDLNAKRAKKQASKTDAEKRAKLPDELFNYIHAAQCRRLFPLAWYNDLTYAPNADGLSKALPELCCNGPSCNSKEPDFLERPPFIDTTPARINDAAREWIAYRTAELRKWRKATSKSFWLEQNVETEIPDTLLMSDACLVALAKAADGLVDCIDGSKVKEFLQPWYGLDNYAEDLFLLLSQSRSNGDMCKRLTRRTTSATSQAMRPRAALRGTA